MPYLIINHVSGNYYELEDDTFLEDRLATCDLCGDSDYLLGYYTYEHEKEEMLREYYGEGYA